MGLDELPCFVDRGDELLREFLIRFSARLKICMKVSNVRLANNDGVEQLSLELRMMVEPDKRHLRKSLSGGVVGNSFPNEGKSIEKDSVPIASFVALSSDAAVIESSVFFRLIFIFSVFASQQSSSERIIGVEANVVFSQDFE